jgi:hypothetical protein
MGRPGRWERRGGLGGSLAVEPLARSGPSEFDAVRAHRDELLAGARSLVLAARHDAGIALCEEASCTLAHTGHQDLCSAAHRLARLSSGPAEVLPVALAAAAFRVELTSALDAIRACRQTAHPVGVCWFSEATGDDGCAELLRLAHDSSR